MGQKGPGFNGGMSGLVELRDIPADRPVLIAGPTASGKSALALRIAREAGGVVVNADALQVYAGWRVLTARPTPEDEAEVPHALYGHLPMEAPYSAGHWLRDAGPLLRGPLRPIIVGGTGLNFAALTEGLAVVPPTPPEVRAEADALPLLGLLAGLDAPTRAAIDARNRARVQRAWEVLRATGRGLAAWQAETPPPLLPPDQAHALVLWPHTAWLDARIARRFDAMLAGGAVEEVRALLPRWRERLPAFRAHGAPELRAHLEGRLTLDEARAQAILATRRYAKRQRTWFRNRMASWLPVALPEP
jgi:tRNA dimethylallyltransferase